MWDKLFDKTSPEMVHAVADLGVSIIALILFGLILIAQTLREKKTVEKQQVRFDKVITVFQETIEEIKTIYSTREDQQNKRHSKDRDQWFQKTEDLYSCIFKLSEDNKTIAVRTEEFAMQLADISSQMVRAVEHCKSGCACPNINGDHNEKNI